MNDFQVVADAVHKGDIKTAVAETQKALDKGADIQNFLDKALIATMDEVGERFSKGITFVPQMLRSAKTMQECMKLLAPFFQQGTVKSKGKVLIGTVKGDLHDIGKNLVAMMLEGAGFTITDMGVDIQPEKFVHKAQEIEPDIIAMSALLSTTMPSMPMTIEALDKAGIRDKVKVIIGGAPVTEKYAREIKADSYGSDAGASVNLAKSLLGLN
ncbi:MAG: corrinoid protein [Thermodesulfobacteriota bacterium]|nr:corrinoid protein [Thermodesulfobacteriota bacterium]